MPECWQSCCVPVEGEDGLEKETCRASLSKITLFLLNYHLGFLFFKMHFHVQSFRHLSFSSVSGSGYAKRLPLFCFVFFS